MATNGTDVSVPVVFTTKTPYPLPSQKFMIPTTWKRYQLSQLVNKALALDRPIPFDFLVHGEILRTSLGQWCAGKGLGEEETLQIEYLESVMPPQKMSSLPHEDWVAAVSCAIPGHFFTAGYDGTLRGFDYSQETVVSSVLHTGPASSIAVIGTSSGEGFYTVLTGSHDLSAKISRVSLGATGSTTATELASLQLHAGPISSVAASVSGQTLLTASWDNLIGIWDAKIPEHDEVPLPPDGSERKKRRKVATERTAKRKAPIGVLKLHTARVSKVVFGSGPNEQGNAYSCGLDSTVRIWDVENGLCTRTITASEKPMLDVAISLSGSTAMAASTDRTVTLYDLNGSDSTNISISSLVHPATPSCIVRSPTQDSHIATGAYDGVVRVWDLRSTKSALTSFKAAQNARKVLSVDWVNDIIAAGGEGGLEVWKFADRTNA